MHVQGDFVKGGKHPSKQSVEKFIICEEGHRGNIPLCPLIECVIQNINFDKNGTKEKFSVKGVFGTAQPI